MRISRSCSFLQDGSNSIAVKPNRTSRTRVEHALFCSNDTFLWPWQTEQDKEIYLGAKMMRPETSFWNKWQWLKQTHMHSVILCLRDALQITLSGLEIKNTLLNTQREQTMDSEASLSRALRRFGDDRVVLREEWMNMSNNTVQHACYRSDRNTQRDASVYSPRLRERRVSTDFMGMFSSRSFRCQELRNTIVATVPTKSNNSNNTHWILKGLNKTKKAAAIIAMFLLKRLCCNASLVGPRHILYLMVSVLQ